MERKIDGDAMMPIATEIHLEEPAIRGVELVAAPDFQARVRLCKCFCVFASMVMRFSISLFAFEIGNAAFSDVFAI